MINKPVAALMTIGLVSLTGAHASAAEIFTISSRGERWCTVQGTPGADSDFGRNGPVIENSWKLRVIEGGNAVVFHTRTVWRETGGDGTAAFVDAGPVRGAGIFGNLTQIWRPQGGGTWGWTVLNLPGRASIDLDPMTTPTYRDNDNEPETFGVGGIGPWFLYNYTIVGQTPGADIGDCNVDASIRATTMDLYFWNDPDSPL